MRVAVSPASATDLEKVWPMTLKTAVQISALIEAGHPRVQHHPRVTGRRGDIDEDRPGRQPPQRHRQILPHPPIHRLRTHALPPRPLGQLHNNQPKYIRSQRSTFPDAYTDDVRAARQFYREHLDEVLARCPPDSSVTADHRLLVGADS